MKTIVIGYGDVNGKGPTKLLLGSEVSITEQVKAITGIKATGKYPEGIARVEFVELVSRNTAVCIKSAEKARQQDAAARDLREKALIKVRPELAPRQTAKPAPAAPAPITPAAKPTTKK